jgi:hypothetical protein
MDTDKAKNITLACLILLNAVLLVCNMLFTDSNKYRMTADAEKNITEVLLINNIRLDAKLNRDFSPKGRLEIQSAEYDNEQLKDIFMQNAAGAELSEENNRNIYRNDYESLSVNMNNGYVVYRNRDIAPGIPDTDFAAGLCRELLKKVGAIYPGFVSDMPQDTPYQTEEGLIFEYRQLFKGSTVNSNYLLITVGENGISRAEFMYARVLGQSKDLRNICAPDEALLTCMYEIKNIYGDRAVVISRVDLIYNRLEGAANGSLYAAPFYRIYVSESIEPVLVNAYTNTAESVQL